MVGYQGSILDLMTVIKRFIETTLIALEKMLLVREDRWHFLLPGASGKGV